MSDEKQYRILVVDDDPKIVVLLTGLLEDEGYQVLTAENGKIALHRIFTEHPDLIVLDILLPDMDGMEICASLRTNSVTRNIPVIFLTAHDTTARIEQAMDMGVSDILGKPLNAIELLLRVRAMLQTCHIQNEPKRFREYIATVNLLREQATQL